MANNKTNNQCQQCPVYTQTEPTGNEQAQCQVCQEQAAKALASKVTDLTGQGLGYDKLLDAQTEPH